MAWTAALNLWGALFTSKTVAFSTHKTYGLHKLYLQFTLRRRFKYDFGGISARHPGHHTSSQQLYHLHEYHNSIILANYDL